MQVRALTWRPEDVAAVWIDGVTFETLAKQSAKYILQGQGALGDRPADTEKSIPQLTRQLKWQL